MRHRVLTPIRITIQNSKAKEVSAGSSYKHLTIGLSTLLALSESLPFMDNIKSNGIIHILSELNKKIAAAE